LGKRCRDDSYQRNGALTVEQLLEIAVTESAFGLFILVIGLIALDIKLDHEGPGSCTFNSP
jgi:hypothetical protein